MVEGNIEETGRTRMKRAAGTTWALGIFKQEQAGLAGWLGGLAGWLGS